MHIVAGFSGRMICAVEGWLLFLGTLEGRHNERATQEHAFSPHLHWGSMLSGVGSAWQEASGRGTSMSSAFC